MIEYRSGRDQAVARKRFRSEAAVAAQMHALVLGYIRQRDLTLGTIADRVSMTPEKVEELLAADSWDPWICWRMWDGLGMAGPFLEKRG